MNSSRTSANDPLRVDFLSAEVLGLPGRIGLTIAPGKRDRARRWDRDLDADLARLRDVDRADVLVSLMEEHEYAMLKIPGLRTRAVELGLLVHWFPIVDVNVPSASELPAFAALVTDIVDAARAGKTVVIHCRGGIGRSGLVAASCLVALGLDPSRAIAATRAARPGAVETAAQESWVSTYARYRATPSEDRVVGCLLAGGLGDALGYPIEFMSAAEIKARGPMEPGTLFSDDTQMTLFVAEGVIRAKQRLDDKGICDPIAVVRGALLRWYATQTGGPVGEWPGWLVQVRELHSRRAPGNTCMGSLAALARGGRPGTVASPPNDSKGCGAVMRAAPFGLGLVSREAAFDLARDTGVLTHGHPSGYLSGAYLAALIWDLCRGTPLHEALGAADVLLRKERGFEEVAAAVAAARAGRGRPSVTALEKLGGGWVGEEALAIALRCVLAHDPSVPRAIETTLWTAAAHGGDSDSTASIAGNLLGAMYGADALPRDWLSQLELREVIERLGRDLFAVTHRGERRDPDAYPSN